MFFVILGMRGAYCFFLGLLWISFIWGQDTALPTDLRQHNLTQFNSNLFHPAFSLEQNDPRSLALWTRWQWQTIDADPSTLFLSYTGRLDAQSVYGLGYLQHNTGTFLHIGGLFNYAYTFALGRSTQLAVGTNIYAFKRELANDDLLQNPNPQGPSLETVDNFIAQAALGVRVTVDRFSAGIASENLFDFNFSNKQRETQPSDKMYLGFVNYDFPLDPGTPDSAFLRPLIYVKTPSEGDTQYGLTTLFSASKFWVQGGYNSYYGVSGGLGGKFFKKWSIGALVEFGVDTELEDRDPTLEIVTAFDFGPGDLRKNVVGFEEEEQLVLIEEKEELPQEKNKDSLAAVEKAKARALAQRLAEQRKLDSIKQRRAAEAARELLEQKRLDSLNTLKLAEAAAARKKAVQDSLAQLQKAAPPKTKERYEEVKSEDGLEAGYYVIANVFGTKKYFDAFMETLRKRGMRPQSFYRSLNGYNYVYLGRYNTREEAQQARDSNFDGNYSDETWIFRVLGD